MHTDSYGKLWIVTLSTLSWVPRLLHVSQYNTWHLYGMLTTLLTNKDVRLAASLCKRFQQSYTKTVNQYNTINHLPDWNSLPWKHSCRLNVCRICIILSGTQFAWNLIDTITLSWKSIPRPFLDGGWHNSCNANISQAQCDQKQIKLTGFLLTDELHSRQNMFQQITVETRHRYSYKRCQQRG